MKPQRRDWLAVAGMLGLLVGEAIFDPGPWLAGQVLVASIAVVGIPWRRSLSHLVLGLVSGAGQTVSLVAYLNGVEYLNFGMTTAPLALLVYALHRWGTHRQVILGTTLWLGPLAVRLTILQPDPDPLTAVLVGWVIVGLLGIAMRYRASLLDEQRAKVRLAERHLLARELHDTVAHQVSAIVVQAEAARFVSSQDPEALSDALANIVDLANESIAEMRRMVGILREEPSRLPSPSNH